jgi:midasin (ATPase involved in ribosome maturation)
MKKFKSINSMKIKKKQIMQNLPENFTGFSCAVENFLSIIVHCFHCLWAFFTFIRNMCKIRSLFSIFTNKYTKIF